MIKNILCAGIILFLAFQVKAQEEKKNNLDIGGALRYNYNLSSWKPNQQARGGDLGFEMFRINVDGIYEDWEVHIDQRFYSAGFGGAFLKYGYFQYNLSKDKHLKIGLIPAYFGVEQFNSYSWFFGLPFYLGFEDDHDMGISYSIDKLRFSLDIAFYKNAELLGFPDDLPISDARYNYDISGRNKEINQFNIRYNYKLGSEDTAKQIIGASIQRGGIWNIDTKEVGHHLAFSLHYKLDYNNWNVNAYFINYDINPINNQNESRDFVEMTAYGAPYNVASKGNMYSISIAHTIEIKNAKPFTSAQFYLQYGLLDKEIDQWENTRILIPGVLISAQPLYVYLDFALGDNHPWLGSEWTNALTTGNLDKSVEWQRRFNINIGYYF